MEYLDELETVLNSVPRLQNKLQQLISHRFTFDRVIEAFSIAGKARSAKVMVKFADDEHLKKRRRSVSGNLRQADRWPKRRQTAATKRPGAHWDSGIAVRGRDSDDGSGRQRGDLSPARHRLQLPVGETVDTAHRGGMASTIMNSLAPFRKQLAELIFSGTVDRRPSFTSSSPKEA